MGRTNTPVPGLTKKLGLIRRYFRTRKYQDEKPTDAAFYRRLQGLSKRSDQDKALEKRWERYRKQDHLPEALVTALCHMYPQLTRHRLTLPLKEFLETLEPIQRAFDAYERAIEHFADSRPQLARYIRGVYAEVESNPDFPLLYRAGWLPDAPVLLRREDMDRPDEARVAGTWRTLLHSEKSAPRVATYRLPEINFTFQELKQRLNPSLKMWNGDSYRLLEVRFKAGCPELVFGPGKYFDYFNNCEVRGLELARWHIDHGGTAFNGAASDLSQRGPPGEVFDLANRPALAGINTVFIGLGFKAPKSSVRQNVFFYHKRGEAVGEAQNVLHVVPAGTFQPFVEDDAEHPRDFSLQRNILRELAEELLDHQEFEGQQQLKEFEEDRVVIKFKRMLQEGEATLHFLGLGLDPVTTKPELLTCMVVNFVTLGPTDFTPNYEGKMCRALLSRDMLDYFSRHDEMLPAGAACLRLAAQHYDHLVGNFGVAKADIRKDVVAPSDDLRGTGRRQSAERAGSRDVDIVVPGDRLTGRGEQAVEVREADDAGHSTQKNSIRKVLAQYSGFSAAGYGWELLIEALLRPVPVVTTFIEFKFDPSAHAQLIKELEDILGQP